MRAKALAELGRGAQALAAFHDASRWLQEPPDTPARRRQAFEAIHNAGVLTLQLGRAAEALPILEEALRRDPEGRWAPQLAQLVAELRAKAAEGR
jgi:tetratricopeptide (TPR) repeat protein